VYFTPLLKGHASRRSTDFISKIGRGPQPALLLTRTSRAACVTCVHARKQLWHALLTACMRIRRTCQCFFHKLRPTALSSRWVELTQPCTNFSLLYLPGELIYIVVVSTSKIVILQHYLAFYWIYNIILYFWSKNLYVALRQNFTTMIKKSIESKTVVYIYCKIFVLVQQKTFQKITNFSNKYITLQQITKTLFWN
jgi:hypothetical protein